MEIIDGNSIKLKRSKLAKSCPSRPARSASMIGSLGLEAILASQKLEHYARCLPVLDAAKIRYEIIEDVPETPVESLSSELPETPAEPSESLESPAV